MATLKIQLFGKFGVRRGTQLVKGLEASKHQELLSYLLLRSDRCHPRETLASMLWSDMPTERSKKYLRQALWHLQRTLTDCGGGAHFIIVTHDWIEMTLKGIWLDVALFERLCATGQGATGKKLKTSEAEMLKKAVQLYKGNLLDGWYQDWCLLERDRLQNLYLLTLDKLFAYSDEHRDYDAAYGYASTILENDRARERTHRQLMRLLYKAGDRTGALRQYERCVQAVEEELGVKPQKDTTDLYEHIRADIRKVSTEPIKFSSLTFASLPQVLVRLKRLSSAVGDVQKGIEQDIKTLEQGLYNIRK
jgi:DNA-binding SARP family transcriptional activator